MRINSRPGDANAPRIDPKTVSEFFAQRAEKASSVGSVRAVIYQDKHPDLAERRDRAEKEALLPLLDIGPSDRVLDVGCGTGRWTAELAGGAAYYHGADFSPGLIEIAHRQNGDRPNARFSVLASAELSREGLGETAGFDKIAMFGLLIYLNDDDVIRTLDNIANVANPGARLLMREPVGTVDRLTIKEHFSEDLEQVYNAIYRTEGELMGAIGDTLGRAGFVLTGSGDVFPDGALNNRSDTRQKWFRLDQRS